MAKPLGLSLGAPIKDISFTSNSIIWKNRKISYEAYNESTVLVEVVEGFKSRSFIIEVSQLLDKISHD